MDDHGPAALRLPASPRSPRLAREYAERFLRDAGHAALATPTALVVSELVTNAMVHADGGCTLRIQVVIGDPPCVRVEVEDAAAETVPTPTADGTGLRLIEDTATRWGVVRTAESKTVWAELSQPAG
jgi:anti-sigma regulatory factor (Ser/Thr protein kinase)